MGIYKTYQEAVIDSGSINNIQVNLNGGEFYTGDSWRGVSAVVRQCNPVDYLDTLESFLASGKRFVDGDRYIEKVGSIVSVVSDDADNIYYGIATPQSTANFPMEGDDERFVLQAAADQVETPEGKEAFDGIPNQTTIDAMNSEAEKESYNSTSEAFGAIDTTAQQVESLGKWEPKSGQPVYIAQINTFAGVKEKRYFVMQYWCNSGYQCEYMNCGILFPTKEEAEIKTKTMLGIPIETPAEREERERLEAAYDLYVTANECPSLNFDEFVKCTFSDSYLRIVDKTGYRKQ